MARKRFSDEDVLDLLRQIELSLASGSDVATACRTAGVSDATYYKWRKKYGGMGKSQLSELKGVEKENAQLKKIVAELELDKLILKESLDFLKPKV
jgi:transposase-like protein